MLKLNTRSLCKKELFCIIFNIESIPRTLKRMLKIAGDSKITSIKIDLKYHFIKIFYKI